MPTGFGNLSVRRPSPTRTQAACAPHAGLLSAGRCRASDWALQALTALDLGAFGFTGAIASDVGSLAQLQELRLDGNGFTGSLPQAFAALVSLRLLDVSSNALGGALDVLGLIAAGGGQLLELRADHNQFTGEWRPARPHAQRALWKAWPA